jgi:hypothetical protein
LTSAATFAYVWKRPKKLKYSETMQKTKFLLILLTLTTIEALAQPLPPIPVPMARGTCLQTNIVFIDTNHTAGFFVASGATNVTKPVFPAGVEIVEKDCPKTWYFGIVNGHPQNWCIHRHDVLKFEAGSFEGVTQLFRSDNPIPDLMVIKVYEVPPRHWTIPAQPEQASK